MLDVGTGTGAIALAIADEHPGARVTGDRHVGATRSRSPRERRADRLDGRARASTTSSPACRPGPWDLVVSNPPYVDAGELATLEPEVRDWEPQGARRPRARPRRSRAGARTCSRRGGVVVLEVGERPGSGDARPARGARLRRRRRVTPDLAAATASSRAGSLSGDRAAVRRSAAGSSSCSRRTPSTASRAAPRRGGRRSLYRLKGRDVDAARPRSSRATSTPCSSCVPELRGAPTRPARRAPGPFTLVLPNPAQRFPWLNTVRSGRDRSSRALAPGAGREVSSGRRGGRDEREPSRRARPTPPRGRARGIRAGVAAAVDGGELPGTPSTVIDLTGAEPASCGRGRCAAAALARLEASPHGRRSSVASRPWRRHNPRPVRAAGLDRDRP